MNSADKRMSGNDHCWQTIKDRYMDEAAYRRALAKTCLELAARVNDAPTKAQLETKAAAILDRANDHVPLEFLHLVH